MKIYFISGLGADKRIFQKLVLSSFLEPVYLDWVIPQTNESLPAYAHRMAALIDSTKPFYLVGVSFGGMIATEIAKQLSPQKTILISSVPISQQLPWYYHFLGQLYIDKVIPATLLTSSNALTYWLFGATDLQTKSLLKQILKDTDKRFLKWAIRAIVTWNNETKPVNLVQINGTTDKILPVRFTNPDFVIPKGGHLMVYNQPPKVSAILASILT